MAVIRFRRIYVISLTVEMHTERIWRLLLRWQVGCQYEILVNLRPPRRAPSLNVETETCGIDIDVGTFSHSVFSSDGRTLAFSQIEHRVGREPEASVEVYQIEGWNARRAS